MIGRVTRLLDSQRVGFIAAADGQEYSFSESSLREITFDRLALGVVVSFISDRNTASRRAEFVRLVR